MIISSPIIKVKFEFLYQNYRAHSSRQRHVDFVPHDVYITLNTFLGMRRQIQNYSGKCGFIYPKEITSTVYFAFKCYLVKQHENKKINAEV